MPDVSLGQRQILDEIRLHGPISRARLAARTGLTPPTVTRLTRELIEFGLLFGERQRVGSRGQPPVPLGLRHDGAYGLGVEFDRGQLSMVVVDFCGRIVAERRYGISDHRPGPVLDAVRRGCQAVLEDAPPSNKLVGVGLAAPAAFALGDRMLIVPGVFDSWSGLDIRQRFAEVVGQVPLVENNASAAALAECMIGIGQHYENLFLFHLTDGIGGGVIVRGKLYRGHNGNAGAIGAFTPRGAPRPSAGDFFETLQAAGIDIDDASTAMADVDNDVVRAWIRVAGGQLRNSIRIVARILDPQAVLITGLLPGSVLRALVSEIGEEPLNLDRPNQPPPEILMGSCGEKSAVIGAGLLPLSYAFSLNGVS